WARWWGWGNPPWGYHQRRSVCLVFVGSACCCMSVCQVLRSMLERRLLQAVCARRQFDRRGGLPPLGRGVSSSTSGVPGRGGGGGATPPGVTTSVVRYVWSSLVLPVAA